MGIMEYFADNHASLLFLLAGLALVLELTVMGLSGLLLFFGIGCFLTAILSYMGVLTAWEAEVLSVGILSSLSAKLLWQPLRRFQSKEVPVDESSDMSGRQVKCAQTITHAGGAIRHSGIDWPARLDSNSQSDSIEQGETCVIVSVDGNIMVVKPLDNDHG